MSGFVGIVNVDGAPVEPELLESLTRTLAQIGPDCQNVWSGGNVGFGHALLRTTWEAENEQQPATLDGECRIVADCRIDARAELIAKLSARGRRGVEAASDPELILHAYAVWGAECVDQLLGDFAFAIWDGRQRQLFCARDHLGIKSFYYAHKGRSLIFSNVLRTLRAHPAVSNRLNDLAIADFLLFRSNQESDTTAFADILRVPPAHTLTLRDGELQIRRFWKLPVDSPLRLKNHAEYVEQFLDLLSKAVRDRLRVNSAGVLMSGGLDSTALAAVAKKVGGTRLDAHTVVFDSLIPDRERHFATIAARHLDLPIRFQVADDYRLFEAFVDSTPVVPDPAHIPVRGPHAPGKELGRIAEQSRVVLYGEGADNALHYEWRPWLKHELRHLRLGSLLSTAVSFPAAFGHLPFCTRLKRRRPRVPDAAPSEYLPHWLNEDFSRRLGLRDRYEMIFSRGEADYGRSLRPYGYSSVVASVWQAIFEGHTPETTSLPLEIRYPFLDLRVLRMMLAVPPIPWCRGKHLLRSSMRNYLPTEILQRPKEGVAVDPVFAKWRKSGFAATVEPPARYINLPVLRKEFPDTAGKLDEYIGTVKLGFFLKASP